MKKKKKEVKNKPVVAKKVIKSKDKYGTMMSAMVENAETQLLVDEVQGKVIDKLAYSFVSKGKYAEGLTFWGLLTCAEESKKNKWTPLWTEPKYQQLTAGEMLLTIGCINPKSKKTEWGACVFNPKERFDERIALTNAKRYALDKHISILQKVSFIQYLKQHKPKQILQVEESFIEEPKTKFTVSDDGRVKTKVVKEKAEDIEEVL